MICTLDWKLQSFHIPRISLFWQANKLLKWSCRVQGTLFLIKMIVFILILGNITWYSQILIWLNGFILPLKLSIWSFNWYLFKAFLEDLIPKAIIRVCRSLTWKVDILTCEFFRWQLDRRNVFYRISRNKLGIRGVLWCSNRCYIPLKFEQILRS